jgi:hypothetical protein
MLKHTMQNYVLRHKDLIIVWYKHVLLYSPTLQVSTMAVLLKQVPLTSQPDAVQVFVKYALLSIQLSGLM